MFSTAHLKNGWLGDDIYIFEAASTQGWASLHLKMDGWKTIRLPIGAIKRPIFRILELLTDHGD